MGLSLQESGQKERMDRISIVVRNHISLDFWLLEMIGEKLNCFLIQLAI